MELIIHGLLVMIAILFYAVYIGRVSNKYRLDKFTTKFYTNQLDDIISYKTTYYIDNAFGKSFAMNKGVNNDISNDEITNQLGIIIADIINTLSPDTKKYLTKLYGSVWLADYIKIQTLSLLLNYTKITINDLTINKFK